MVIGVYWAWQVTGDDKWMMNHLPALERGLEYALTNPERWDNKYRLVKRPHSCDTWDFNIGQTTDMKYFVIANCDQSGYYQGFELMSQMYHYAGDENKSRYWSEKASAYKDRTNHLLWDGKKYIHHFHLENIEHNGFDEGEQLSMGNTWAIVRGLANTEQSRAIVNEYKDRYIKTKDAYPWWSIQPGYPNRLGYYSGAHLSQGGYANGGLMPWVGGELCFGAFLCGEERYALNLFLDYWKMLKDNKNQVYIWYWPDGQPGIRTSNTTTHCGWGMAEWIRAIYEGLAGVVSIGKCFQKVQLSPRWAITDLNKVYAITKFEASNSYFAYEFQMYPDMILLRYAGSGDKVNFHVLIPSNSDVESVSVNGNAVEFSVGRIGNSLYADFSGDIYRIGCAEIKMRII